MKFEEQDTIEISQYNSPFIYFLLKNDEVVYVGQTIGDLGRPFSHKEKDFDFIYIKYCEYYELDEFEDFYIKKYKPKYNKIPNMFFNRTLNRVKNIIKENGYSKYARKNNFNKLLDELNIEKFSMNNIEYIDTYNCNRILDYINIKEYGD